MNNCCGHWTLKLQCSINDIFWQTSPKNTGRQFFTVLPYTNAAIILDLKVNGSGYSDSHLPLRCGKNRYLHLSIH